MRRFMAIAREELLSNLKAYLPEACSKLQLDTPRTVSFYPAQLPLGPITAHQLPAVIVSPRLSEIEPETAGQMFYVAENHLFDIHVAIMVPRGEDEIKWGEMGQRTLELYTQAIEYVLDKMRENSVNSLWQLFPFAIEHDYQARGFWEMALPNNELNDLLAVTITVKVAMIETKEVTE